MARWFRSEPMQYISLIVNEDAAHDCLTDLGKLGVIQFTDLNPELTPFQRRYVSYVKRCDELERTLRFFGSEIERLDLNIVPAGRIDDFVAHATTHSDDSAHLEELHHDETTTTTTSPTHKNKSGMELLKSLEAELIGYENHLRELNGYHEQLTTEYNEKIELHEVLEKARHVFLAEAPRWVRSAVAAADSGPTSRETKLSPLLEDDEDDHLELTETTTTTPHLDDGMRFASIAGVVASDERIRFERMIFRATRGNCYVRFADILQPLTDPRDGQLAQKSVFMVFFKSDSIRIKLARICDAFSAHRYTIPDQPSQMDEIMEENKKDIVDSRTILHKNQDARLRLCELLAQHLERWTWAVKIEKAIYHSLNMFRNDVSGMLRGEGWVVSESLRQVQRVVEQSHLSMDMRMPSLVDLVPQPWPKPPTHFVTNEFTYAYQEFVNTYGIPRYREANPALMTAATFPFLFGVMYGDIGHGMFLLLVGLYLLWNGKANANARLDEISAFMHSSRYMLTMMGFFAVYAGFIYNDLFSLGLDLFGSRYHFDGQDDLNVTRGTEAIMKAPYGSAASVYPFGLDPIWHVSSNELLFFNSFKMKLSVIFGVLQMFAGTCLKGANALYFKEHLDFRYEFIPMILFASSLFVYMIFLIFYKWSVDWNSRMLSATCIDPNGAGWESADYNGKWKRCEPISGVGTCTPWGHPCTGSDDTATKCQSKFGGAGGGCQPPNLISTLMNIALNPGVVDEPMFAHQAILQLVLLFIAFGSVPVLLLAKPYFLSQQHHQYAPIVHHAIDDNDDNVESNRSRQEEHDDDEHGFGEIIIHQSIETIEFVLGMVSNTASYLRLWALSLAHSQLATVFWDMFMLIPLNMNFLFAYIAYGVFAGATFAVLLSMDVLECFLHALRLHWVEFQSKFFAADGIRFAPYSFQQILMDAAA